LLLEEGANVLFADLTLRLESEILVKKYSEGNPHTLFKRTDVTAWTDLENLFTTANSVLGSIDIVCPGASVYEPPFSDFW
jgi:3-hydroxybutyrate dehydrogenase